MLHRRDRPDSVQDMLQYIKGRLAASPPRSPQPPAPAPSTATNTCLFGEASGRLKWVQPSGALFQPFIQQIGMPVPVLYESLRSL